MSDTQLIDDALGDVIAPRSYADVTLPNLSGLIPASPFIPDPEPVMVRQVFNYEQLKEYRLMSAPYIVRANYDTVQQMIEDGILKKHEHDYLEWLAWIEANL